ncbi:MAG: divergent polysaccharide deacetylase family protein [Treponema sp.]|jgi:polysaccharide deacetylase 2 family uncharacterized protein YibQ|nr:divergent polysaccharide deacetylase family protein [Treponema sp.]
MKQTERQPESAHEDPRHRDRIRILLVTGWYFLLGVLAVAVGIFVRDLIALDAPPAPVRAEHSDAPVVPALESPDQEALALQEPPALYEMPDPLDPVVESIRPAGALPEQRSEPQHKGMVALVIDDAGNNLEELEPFLHFPGPLTVAVLPGLPYSAEAARRIRSAGKELFLHQPMEAIGGQYPGPGAIYGGMSEATIREILERNLAEIGPVAGMNNHQGSKITRDPQAMEIVLTLCREQGIYFLDSRTIADTAAPGVAKRLGIPLRERDVFIDNIQEKTAMIRYLEEGLQKADRQGAAVMIGHTWSTELAALLAEVYPGILERGYSFTTISQLFRGSLEYHEDPGH